MATLRVHLRAEGRAGGLINEALCWNRRARSLTEDPDEVTCTSCHVYMRQLGGTHDAPENLVVWARRHRARRHRENRRLLPKIVDYGKPEPTPVATPVAPEIVDHGKPDPAPEIVDHGKPDPGQAHRGRPAFPPGQARDQVVRVRLTDAELADVRGAAAREGRSVSAYVRRLLQRGSDNDARRATIRGLAPPHHVPLT